MDAYSLSVIEADIQSVVSIYGAQVVKKSWQCDGAGHKPFVVRQQTALAGAVKRIHKLEWAMKIPEANECASGRPFDGAEETSPTRSRNCDE
jgi:hypothetical protein